MAFVDELRIHMKAGDGGHGVVRWLRARGKAEGGAAGGNGGKGGDVFARGVRDIGILSNYKHKKEFKAGRGEDGMKKSMYGHTGADLFIDVPVGSIITNMSTGETFQILEEGQTAFLLKGGRGGFGNEHFKASTNTSPYESTQGKKGEEGDFYIELELIVDAGFVGFPNAGKSSLLNAITNAQSKVASYQFTTLEPNLGDFYRFILADIPGLIEGASEGKGLGYKFLRHIKRTKLLLHCVSLENEDIASAHKTIRGELEAYDTELAAKREILILTKTDLVDEETLKKAVKKAQKLNKEVLTVSIIDDASLKQFSDNLIKILRDLNKVQ